jgi:hypothetical protein
LYKLVLVHSNWLVYNEDECNLILLQNEKRF